MTLNVLDMAKQVCLKVNVDPPTALAGSTQALSQRIIALIYDEARFLRNQKVFPQQRRPGNLTTVSGDSTYALPADFWSWVPDTVYNSNLKRPMNYITPAQYYNQQYGVQNLTYPSYRIFGADFNNLSANGQLNIQPTPTTNGEVYYYEYVTRFMFSNSTFSNQFEVINADTDYCLFDDDLMLKGLEWRFRESKGMDYAEQKAEHDKMVANAVSRWTGSTTGTFGNRQCDGPRYTIPDGSWPL